MGLSFSNQAEYRHPLPTFTTSNSNFTYLADVVTLGCEVQEDSHLSRGVGAAAALPALYAVRCTSTVLLLVLYYY